MSSQKKSGKNSREEQAQEALFQITDEEANSESGKEASNDLTTLPIPSEGHLPSWGFIKVEANLTSLGFFTPTSKKIRSAKTKTIKLMRDQDGKRIEAQVRIVAAGDHGLPTTADQDKYLAFQKYLTDLKSKAGVIQNPVAFSSGMILKMLNRTDAGKNYGEIDEWLQRMTWTGVESKGAVYLAGRKKYATDRFTIFSRSVTVGSELDDGTVADQNYVWLSDWQLENINQNHVLPIDLDTYQKIENHIAKALIPLLQIWLFASAKTGYFVKRYEEFAQILCLTQHKERSRIERQLKRSLDELVHYEYISSWRIERVGDTSGYNIVLIHGEKFWRDQDSRLEVRERMLLKNPAEGETDPQGGSPPEPAAVSEPMDDDARDLLGMIVQRKVAEPVAEKYVRSLSADERAIARGIIVYYDSLVADRRPMGNPPGYLVSLLERKSGATIPPEIARRAYLKQAEETQRAAEASYEEECRQSVRRERAILEQVESEVTALGAAEYDALRAQAAHTCQRAFPNLDADRFASAVAQEIRNIVRRNIESR